VKEEGGGEEERTLFFLLPFPFLLFFFLFLFSFFFPSFFPFFGNQSVGCFCLFAAGLDGLDVLLRESRGDLGDELLDGGASGGVDGVGEGVIKDVAEHGLGVQELLEVVGDVILEGLDQVGGLRK